MELIINNSENYFDPTPKLKSSPVPILFIPFNEYENKCSYCGNQYSETLLFYQKYCKICLLSYIKNTTDEEIYLDVYISTNSTRCSEHETTRNTNFCTRNIQEWCEYCSEILWFKQVPPYSLYFLYYYSREGCRKIIENGENCKLCGKLIYQNSSYGIEFRLCSSCYQISSGWVESTLTKKPISILYLPWWDNQSLCLGCYGSLKFISDCHKWCSYCYIIVTECRYCLTTNIIFGITDQSQCKKCKKIQTVDIVIDDIDIDILKIISGNHDVDELIISKKYNDFNHQIADYMNNVDKNSNIMVEVHEFIENILSTSSKMFKNLNNRNNNSSTTTKWIPYSQITNLEKIAEGGFSIIYKAMHKYDTVIAVKKILNSRDISKCFLNELKSLYQCYDMAFIIKCYGITQDPETKEYMLIMEYANGGNLHNYLQKYFINITWDEKLRILLNISKGLNVIHKKNFIHRDFHSGNVLLSFYKAWLIADLGLSQPANNTSLNNEIYGVIPYIAPEIFKGATFSKESDIYSMGMIMWELTTGCKPFATVDHDTNLIYKIIDGKRPKITNDTPECFTNLMKRCWDSDSSKRPSIKEIVEIVSDWLFRYRYIAEFRQAEKKRLELIQSMKLGPEFGEKPHSGAIYISRALSSLISKSSSIISFDVKQEYITKEHDLDINSIQSSCLPNVNYTIQNSLNIQHSGTINTSRPLRSLISKSSSINSSSMVLFNVKQDNEIEKLNKHSNNNQEYISKEFEFDINNVQSSPSSKTNLTIQNSLNIQHPNSIYTSRPLSALISALNSSRKHNIEESEIESQKRGKHVKTDDDSLNSES